MPAGVHVVAPSIGHMGHQHVQRGLPQVRQPVDVLLNPCGQEVARRVIDGEQAIDVHAVQAVECRLADAAGQEVDVSPVVHQDLDAFLTPRHRRQEGRVPVGAVPIDALWEAVNKVLYAAGSPFPAGILEVHERAKSGSQAFVRVVQQGLGEGVDAVQVALLDGALQGCEGMGGAGAVVHPLLGKPEV